MVEKYLIYINDQFAGNIVIDENLSKKLTDGIIGKNSIISKIELFHDIIKNNLGDLTIIGIQSDKTTGFQAMAFRDNYNNVGISYKGSDVDFSNKRGSFADWFDTNLKEFVTDNSAQRLQAFEFFIKYASGDNNYLYGHSLGGNLTTHTLLEFSDKIQEAFTVNGTPVSDNVVSQKNNREILNSNKYNCNVIGGDLVGQLKHCNGYEDNIKWVINNQEMDYSIVTAHLIQAATYNENDNFVLTTKEEANRVMGKFEGKLLQSFQTIHEKINSEFIQKTIAK